MTSWNETISSPDGEMTCGGMSLVCSVFAAYVIVFLALMVTIIYPMHAFVAWMEDVPKSVTIPVVWFILPIVLAMMLNYLARRYKWFFVTMVSITILLLLLAAVLS